jgi:hypothetical protein
LLHLPILPVQDELAKALKRAADAEEQVKALLAKVGASSENL